MAIRTLLAVGLLALAVGSGCVGISGERYYDETGKKSRGLNEIVDCPTCPSGHGPHDAIVHAAPGGARNGGVIAPHAKFHPVPTRPVFAPKVMPASATVEALPQHPHALAIAAAPKPAQPIAASIDSDEAPAPPMMASAAKPSSRSVLKASEPQRLSEDTMASVLVASKATEPTLIDKTDAAPSPTPADEPEVTNTPTPVKKIATQSPPAAVRTTGDGWRPRVAN